MPRKDVILKRIGTAAAWTSANPILLAGEEGFESDTLKSKVGDGTSTWTALSYAYASAATSDPLKMDKSANLSDVANASTARTNLGVAIGTNVQAWDSDLDVWATKTAPTGTVVGTNDTQTLSNKRIGARLSTLTDATSATPNIDVADFFKWTLGGNRTLALPAGTPTDGQKIYVRLIQDATGSRTLTYASGYFFPVPGAPTLSTAAGSVDTLEFTYNLALTRWELTAYAIATNNKPITGLVVAGTNITLSGAGTTTSPYVVSSSAAGGVTSVNTRTGAVTLTKTDVGLANVDNTSDANKPVSTAQQTALDDKLSKSIGGIVSGPTIFQGQVEIAGQDLQMDLNSIQNVNNVFANGNIVADRMILSSIESSSGTMTVDGNFDMIGYKVTGVANGTVASDVVNKSQLDTKQNTLVSGTSIKTVNGTTILGSGDLSTTPSDASTTAKGIVQLAGDLGGAAASPQVLIGRDVYQNYVSNPSFESGIAAGWTTYGGGTKTQNTTTAQFGTASGQQSAGGTAVDGGFNQSITLPAGTFTMSYYAKMTSNVTRQNMVVRNNGVTGTTMSFFAYPGNTNWNRYSQTFVNPTAGTVEILIGLGYSGTSLGDVQFDGVMIELNSTATTYFDGSTTGSGYVSYAWNGTANQSSSYRTTIMQLLNTNQLAEGSLNQYFSNPRAVAAMTGSTIAPSAVNAGTISSGNASFTGSIRFGYNTTAITANTTLTTSSAPMQDVNATSGAISITPPATTAAGYEFTITKTDSSANAVTLVGSFNGVTNPTLTPQWKYMTFVTTGTSGVFRIRGNN